MSSCKKKFACIRRLLFPRTLCYRAPYYVVPTFSSVFCCFFPCSLRKKYRIFCAALLGGGLGVWGGVLGGWVSGRGGRGFRGVWGGIIAFMCVCVLSFGAFPFFNNGCKRFFLCAKTLFFLSGASGFVIVRAAWIVSVTFGFFGWVLRVLCLYVFYMIFKVSMISLVYMILCCI